MIARFRDNRVGRGTGFWSAVAVSLGGALYLAVLAAGLASRASSEEPIADPWFAIMEWLIIGLMPATVMLFSAIHEIAPAPVRTLTRAALTFVAICAALTAALHATILAIGRNPAIRASPLSDALLAFRWPSLAYAVDIVAWDFFFALAALCVAPAFIGNRTETIIRASLVLVGVLSLAGLLGVLTSDMGLRNIGILGYGVLWPATAALIAVHWRGEAAPGQ